jgi:hypothetical protein
MCRRFTFSQKVDMFFINKSNREKQERWLTLALHSNSVFLLQTNAGAVMITDLVFWFILYPFLAHNQYEMNFVSILFCDFRNSNNLQSDLFGEPY